MAIPTSGMRTLYGWLWNRGALSFTSPTWMLTVPLITYSHKDNNREWVSALCTDLKPKANLWLLFLTWAFGKQWPGVTPLPRPLLAQSRRSSGDPHSSFPFPSAHATDREMRSHTYPLAVTDRKFNREF